VNGIKILLNLINNRSIKNKENKINIEAFIKPAYLKMSIITEIS